MSLVVYLIYSLLEIVYSNYDCHSEYLKLLEVHGFNHDEKKEKIFHENCKLINTHNSQIATNHVEAVRLKLNKFAFYTKDEYIGLLKFDTKTFKVKQSETMTECSSKSRNVDWVEDGAVAPIKDQGMCGSCWAFSAASAIESANFLNTKKMVVLSEQELVDCCKGQSYGCNGGLMNDAFEYVINHGLHEAEEYPYKAKDGRCKHYNSTSPVVSIKKYCDIKANDNDCLLNAVEKFGPVSIAIDASGDHFRFYGSGVIKCSPGEKNLDHGVVVVGYHKGYFGFGSYYKVRNSWGTSWGMDGYFKLSMNENNNCGATLSASYPLVNIQPCVGN